jgi:hypothetical protein
MEGLTLNDLQNFEVSLSFSSVLLSMLFSALCAQAVAIAYRKYATSLGNRISFSQIFWLLASVTTVVITIVKFSLALSLGLVGALSIVRFRAAIKEPEELVYLFLVIAIGLSMGAGQHMAGITLTIFSITAIIAFSKFSLKRGDSLQLFDVDVLTVSGPSDKNQLFDEYIASQHPDIEYELASLNADNGKFEAVYRIYTHATRIQRDDLTSWISREAHNGVSIQFGRTIKIPQ